MGDNRRGQDLISHLGANTECALTQSETLRPWIEYTGTPPEWHVAISCRCRALLPSGRNAGFFRSQVVHVCTAGHGIALPLHLGPDLVGPVDVEVLLVDPGNLRLELVVANFAGTRRPSFGGVVGPRSELQRGADRLDSPAILARIDVADYFFGRPSSSVAKKIEASFNISLARRMSVATRKSPAMAI